MYSHASNVFFTGTYAVQTWDVEQVRKDQTDFIKRMRARAEYENRGRIRYLIVTERHKSGAFHVHGVFHGDWTLDCALVESSWKEGFAWTDYCDAGAAWYVAKYMQKEVDSIGVVERARVRCSRNPTYGGWVVQRDPEIVKELMRNKPKEDQELIWAKNLRQLMILEQPKSGIGLLKDLVMGKTTVKELETAHSMKVKRALLSR